LETALHGGHPVLQAHIHALEIHLLEEPEQDERVLAATVGGFSLGLRILFRVTQLLTIEAVVGAAPVALGQDEPGDLRRLVPGERVELWQERPRVLLQRELQGRVPHQPEGRHHLLPLIRRREVDGVGVVFVGLALVGIPGRVEVLALEAVHRVAERLDRIPEPIAGR
jgi:hypothetical protein